MTRDTLRGTTPWGYPDQPRKFYSHGASDLASWKEIEARIGQPPITYRRVKPKKKKRAPLTDERREKMRWDVRLSGGGRIGGVVAGHRRWHVARDIVNENCKLCRGESL